MRVYVTGALGLVGTALRSTLRERGHVADGGDLPLLDVTRPETLAGPVAGFRPEWIVNLAAWTEVDACEADPRRAALANAGGAAHVARLAVESGARLLQVSTDYVFDGRKGTPYAEGDRPNPLSVYGRTKLDGERAVEEIVPPGRRLIVRGQSLYGPGRKSFPDAILRAAKTKQAIPVVTDQVVSPTFVGDFAGGLALLLERGAPGLFHLSSSGSCTWNEFARAVLDEAGVADVRIEETTAAALGRPAPRPAWSVFDLRRFEAATGTRPRPWREQLRSYIRARGVPA